MHSTLDPLAFREWVHAINQLDLCITTHGNHLSCPLAPLNQRVVKKKKKETCLIHFLQFSRNGRESCHKLIQPNLSQLIVPGFGRISSVRNRFEVSRSVQKLGFSFTVLGEDVEIRSGTLNVICRSSNCQLYFNDPKEKGKKKPRLTFKFGNVSLQCRLIRSSQFVGRILFEFHIALLLLLPGRRFSCIFILMLSTRSIPFIHLASIIHLFLIFIRNSCFILLLLVILATLHITMSSILVATSSTLTQCRQALDPLISSHRTGTFPGFLSIFSHCLQSAAYNPSA